MARVSRVALVGLLAAVALESGAVAQSLEFSLFERYLESLRQQAGIPGLSVAIVEGGRIVWERGLGYQDVESSVAAMPDTPYPVADLTQTFTAVVLMRCVERGGLSLDEPVRDSGLTVRQLLAHASTAQPIGSFKYDRSRYAWLTPVAERCASQPYRKHLWESILDRLGMLDSVPGRDVTDASSNARELFAQVRLDRFAAVLRRLATPYKVDRKGRRTRSELPPEGIDGSTGLISTVRDLARYDAALDDAALGDRLLLTNESLTAMWTNAQVGGVAIPTGLGWFVQTYNGERLVWHFGLSPDSYSSLVLKVPGRKLTLILMANSDGLSAPFPLANGDVTSSLFAQLFLRLFV